MFFNLPIGGLAEKSYYPTDVRLADKSGTAWMLKMRDNHRMSGVKKQEHQLFPLFLKLVDRPCLVVGAGAIAESKIRSLLNAGAKLSVVALEATPKVQAWARSRDVRWHRRNFQRSDLRGMFLVVAATGSTKLHQEIFREARRFGVLCNVVDVPSLCDFYYPAVVQRGALQIAISTSGQSPALAQRLRKELGRQFGPDYEGWLNDVGKTRQEVRARNLRPEERNRLLHEQASAAALTAFRKRGKKPLKPRQMY
jgi:precorrin-2 dehydrogenase / sirohydrochlorin ferrochelatase